LNNKAQQHVDGMDGVYGLKKVGLRRNPDNQSKARVQRKGPGPVAVLEYVEMLPKPPLPAGNQRAGDQNRPNAQYQQQDDPGNQVVAEGGMLEQ